MRAKHTFIPITNEARLKEATNYVVEQSVQLARVVLQRNLQVDTVCFFSHSRKEYDSLRRAVLARGPVSRFTHGATLYVDCDFEVASHRLRIFGVREPDADREEIGYGDYPVDDYPALVAASRDNPYAHEIVTGRGKSLLELRHPDFDVRGYVVARSDHTVVGK